MGAPPPPPGRDQRQHGALGSACLGFLPSFWGVPASPGPSPPTSGAGGSGGGSPIGVNMELLESPPPSPPHHITSTALGVPMEPPPPNTGPQMGFCTPHPNATGAEEPRDGCASHTALLTARTQPPPPTHTPTPPCTPPHFHTLPHHITHNRFPHPPPRHSRRGPAAHTHTHTQCHTPCHTQICHPHPPLLTHTPGTDPTHSP